MSVVLIGYNCSARFGGEAMLPLRWFEQLRERVHVELVTHVRNRAELEARWGPDAGVHYIDTERVSRRLHALNRWILGTDSGPAAAFLFGGVDWLLFDLAAASWIRRRNRRAEKGTGPFCAKHPSGRSGKRGLSPFPPSSFDVAHRVIPVSPHWPCFYHSLGCPLVVGPLNGGFVFPPGFENAKAGERAGVVRLRPLARLAHRLVPGIEHAAAILAANETTRDVLPPVIRRRVELMCENGVDTQRFAPRGGSRADPPVDPPRSGVHFIYVGRLVPYKCPDVLVEAFGRVRRELGGPSDRGASHLRGPASAARLTMVGDGPLRPRLEALAAERGVQHDVVFTGALSPDEVVGHLQQADVFCLPSIREPGGAVALEAMACELPAIVADYAGPAQYVTPETGIKVPLPPAGPKQEETFVAAFANAMVRLARDADLRHCLGTAAREQVVRRYTWESKRDSMLALYERVSGRAGLQASGAGSRVRGFRVQRGKGEEGKGEKGKYLPPRASLRPPLSASPRPPEPRTLNAEP